MKKILALILVFCAMIPLFAYSEGNDAIFNELGNYLLYADRLLEDELFAIQYVEKFNRTRTQDDLLIARCAVQSALREIRSMEIPEMSMTDDQYFSYMLEGAEVEALSLVYEYLEVIRDEKINILTGMYHTLLADVYFEPALDNLMKDIGLHRKDIKYDARDYVLMTNYLLMQLKNGGKTDAFWNDIKESTVVLRGEMDVFYEDKTEVARMAGENLDQMEDNIDKLEVLGGFEDFMLNITVEAAETGDLSVFKNNRTEIIGETQVFPMPEWCLPTDMEYTYIFSEPGTDNLFIHTMGNEISYAPDRIKIYVSDISFDDVLMYLESLIGLEYNVQHELSTENETIKLYAIAEKGGCSLNIIWTEIAAGSDIVLYLMPPAASLVPYMYWK
ncbi:MAG: hypothetical protein IIW08_05410 [Clostridia bacterium]|nr:hypothetical protein [Clostridia bacterium]